MLNNKPRKIAISPLNNSGLKKYKYMSYHSY